MKKRGKSSHLSLDISKIPIRSEDHIERSVYSFQLAKKRHRTNPHAHAYAPAPGYFFKEGAGWRRINTRCQGANTRRVAGGSGSNIHFSH